MSISKNSGKKNIGIVVAIEMDAVKEKYGDPIDVIDKYGYKVYVYENNNANLYFLNSGAGEINSAGGTQVLISDFNVDMVFNFGVVGALTENIITAELCVVSHVIDVDFGSDGWLNLSKGQHPEYDSRLLKTDEKLLYLAKEINPNIRVVWCASTNSFRNDEADKSKLHNEFGVDICEMEAAGIVYTCRRSNVPCLLVKAVSDSLIGGGAEFFTELNRVSLICFNMLDEIINNLK